MKHGLSFWLVTLVLLLLVLFIGVGTPPDEDGSADLQYVLEAARNIGRHMTEEMREALMAERGVATAAELLEAALELAAVDIGGETARIPDLAGLEEKLADAQPAEDLLSLDGMTKELAVDLALRDAYHKMRHFLMTTQGLGEDEAISLMSIAVDFGITQVVDGNWGVHAVVKKSIFPARDA